MLLSIQDLTVTVATDQDLKILVDHASLHVKEQSITALVGGSGSGKTTLGLAVLRLLAAPLIIQEGKVLFSGDDLFKYSEEEMAGLRGQEIAMVFQDPLSALNPVFPVGYQIEEVLKYHTSLTGQQRKERVNDLLSTVGIPDPSRVGQSYPHQLSGGMRQRALIAQAIAAGPKLLIADEPTSSLDVTLQARIMDLFGKLKQELKLSILLITHDLGVVKHLADEVFVMCQGKIIESGLTGQVMSHPREDYTRRLLETLRS